MKQGRLIKIVPTVFAAAIISLLIAGSTVWYIFSSFGGILLIGLVLQLIAKHFVRKNASRFPALGRFNHMFLKYIGEYAPGVEELSNQIKKNGKQVDFVFYFDGPEGADHHVLMWIDHLKKLQKDYVIVSRKHSAAVKYHGLGLHVVFAPNQGDLEIAETLGAKVVFYANNGMRNTHMLRFNSMIHVQLLHGESDKISSYNPLSGIYDVLAVAGPTGQTRYAANDVYIPKRKFKIASRPQIAQLQVASGPIMGSNATVLYATTWTGFHEENNHSSMPLAEDIVDRLIANGHCVVFRPHPYCYKDKKQRRQIARIAARLKSVNAENGTTHCISNDSEFDMIYPEVNDCINACDIMVSDVTSVLADWIYTTKPYVTIDVQSAGPNFAKQNPLTVGGYVLNRSLEGFDLTLNKAVQDDPLRQKRIALRESVLGVSMDDNPETIFLEAMNDIFENHDKIESQRRLIADEE